MLPHRRTRGHRSLSHESHHSPRQKWSHFMSTALHSDMQLGKDMHQRAHLQLLCITGRQPPHSLRRLVQWLVAYKELLGLREHTMSTGKENCFAQSDRACMIFAFLGSPPGCGQAITSTGDAYYHPAALDVMACPHLGETVHPFQKNTHNQHYYHYYIFALWNHPPPQLKLKIYRPRKQKKS